MQSVLSCKCNGAAWLWDISLAVQGCMSWCSFVGDSWSFWETSNVFCISTGNPCVKTTIKRFQVHHLSITLWGKNWFKLQLWQIMANKLRSFSPCQHFRACKKKAYPWLENKLLFSLLVNIMINCLFAWSLKCGSPIPKTQYATWNVLSCPDQQFTTQDIQFTIIED